jgi:formylglycine-generating enzyme required for sulfatase activity
MVLVFSPHANNSEEIKKEIALASQRKITVIPIRLEEVTPSKAFRYELVTRNWIDFFPHWDQGFQRLVERISALTSVAPIQPPPRAAPPPRLAPMWMIVVASGVTLVAGASYYWIGGHHQAENQAIATQDSAKAPVSAALAGPSVYAKAQSDSARVPSDTPSPIKTVAMLAESPSKPSASAPQSPPTSAAVDAPTEPSPTSATFEAPKQTDPSPPSIAIEAPKQTDPPTTLTVAEAPRQTEPSPPSIAVEPRKQPPTTLTAVETPRQTEPSPPSIAVEPPKQTDHTSASTTLGPPTSTENRLTDGEAPPTQIAALIPQAPMRAPGLPAIAELKVGPPAPVDEGTRGGQVFKECDKCPEMVVVPRGSAILGSPVGEPARQSNEQTPHEVLIAKPFAVGRFTVTFDEWDACVADGGCNHYSPDDDDFGRGRRPVIFVSWDDAQAYVAWLKKKTGQPYRLLSEAEWEYAARGCPTASCPNAPFWFGSIRPEFANYDSRYAYDGSPTAERQRQTTPVDAGKPNSFGLYNMLGNVQQWVEDCWNPSPKSTPSDPAPVLTGDCADRVIRGGSWADKPGNLRAAARSWDTANDQESPNIGIRVARTLSP